MKITKKDLQTLGSFSLTETCIDIALVVFPLMIGLIIGPPAVFSNGATWLIVIAALAIALGAFCFVMLIRKISRRSKLSKAINSYYLEGYGIYDVARALGTLCYFGRIPEDKDSIVVDHVKLVYSTNNEEFTVFEDKVAKAKALENLPKYELATPNSN